MPKRKMMSKGRDKQYFRDTAKKTRAINISAAPQRGGTRL